VGLLGENNSQKEAEMALEFKCQECGEHIITKFLKAGEVAKCRNCGAENVVPENALETDQEPKDIIPTGIKLEMVKKTKGEVRPVESVIGLSIITLSIYFWVYLFKTLREMKNSFTFDAQEISPDRVKPILIVYLLVSLLVAIILEVIGWPFGTFAHPSKTTGFYAVLVITNLISAALFVAFFSSFAKLIEACQKKVGMLPFNKSIFWMLIAISIVLNFASIGITPLIYLDLLVFVVFLYLIVMQVNRIWTESGGVGAS
jgi:DNA-directed RNA polymerase subunit RPC12/RpoP